MGFVLRHQNDDAGINASDAEHLSALYVFEHVTGLYHLISPLREPLCILGVRSLQIASFAAFSHQNTFLLDIRDLVFGGLLSLREKGSVFLLGISLDFSL
jgi:hypothetical protein